MDDGITLPEFKPKIKPNVSRFILYLRLIDAESGGIGFGEMGRVLFKGKADRMRSAKGALRQGRMMAAHGYRELLLMSNR